MTKEVNDIIDFVKRAGKLEKTLRFSASLKGLKESAADHSWRLTLMTFLVADQFNLKINLNKALRIAIVHDLAEAVTGDIDAYKVVSGEVSLKNKEKDEKKAIQKMIKGFSLKDSVEEPWREYLEQSSKEARFVKALDKLEAFLTLLEAGHKKYKKKVFYSNYADEAVNKFPALKPFLFDVKKKLKEEFSKGKIEWKE